MGAAGVLAGVVAQFEELLDVGVPRLQVDAGGALAPAALVDRRHSGVEGLQERHDAVGAAVGAADQAAPAADPRPGDADAAGELRQFRHLVVALVDGVQFVAGRVDQEAGRHLGVPGAGVEERRRAGQVRQARHQPVEGDRLVRRPGEPARHPQQPVLRCLHDQARLGVAQQVPVGDRPQAEVLEAQVAVGIHRGVELAGVPGHEGGRLVADQAEAVGVPDRSAETGDALAVDLLVHVCREQPGGELRVLRFLADQVGGGLDRQPVQFGGGGAVVEAVDGPGRHAQRVDLVQVGYPAVDRRDDPVDVDRLDAAVAFADPHHRPALLRPGGLFCCLCHELSPREPMAVRARGEDTVTRGQSAARGGWRRPSRAAFDRRTPRWRTARWQVFGLAGVT